MMPLPYALSQEDLFFRALDSHNTADFLEVLSSESREDPLLAHFFISAFQALSFKKDLHSLLVRAQYLIALDAQYANLLDRDFGPASFLKTLLLCEEYALFQKFLNPSFSINQETLEDCFSLIVEKIIVSDFDDTDDLNTPTLNALLNRESVYVDPWTLIELLQIYKSTQYKDLIEIIFHKKAFDLTGSRPQDLEKILTLALPLRNPLITGAIWTKSVTEYPDFPRFFENWLRTLSFYQKSRFFTQIVNSSHQAPQGLTMLLAMFPQAPVLDFASVKFKIFSQLVYNTLASQPFSREMRAWADQVLGSVQGSRLLALLESGKIFLLKWLLKPEVSDLALNYVVEKYPALLKHHVNNVYPTGLTQLTLSSQALQRLQFLQYRVNSSVCTQSHRSTRSQVLSSPYPQPSILRKRQPQSPQALSFKKDCLPALPHQARNG